MEEVDAFLDAVRGTFLGVRQPPLTAEEIRTKNFATTRLRPGYHEEEVDAFLGEAEARLRVRCAECGAETAETAEFCVLCGAPAAGPPPVAADPSASGPNDDVETVPATAGDASPSLVLIRRGRMYFLAAFVFCLVLFSAGEYVGNKVPTDTELGHTLDWVMGLILVGVLGSLSLFMLSLRQSSGRQVGWAWLPILSLSLLA